MYINNALSKKIKIRISNITTRVIYLIIFNELLYKNKFVIEKHMKIIIKTRIHIKFIE